MKWLSSSDAISMLCVIVGLFWVFFPIWSLNANSKWQSNIFVSPQKKGNVRRIVEVWLIWTEVKGADWRGRRWTATVTSDKSAEPLIRRSVSLAGNDNSLEPDTRCHIHSTSSDHAATHSSDSTTSVETLECRPVWKWKFAWVEITQRWRSEFGLPCPQNLSPRHGSYSPRWSQEPVCGGLESHSHTTFVTIWCCIRNQDFTCVGLCSSAFQPLISMWNLVHFTHL